MMIKKHNVMVDGRNIHFLRAGTGVPLILLHASPVSSQAFQEEYIPRFSKNFTCIAPDTPGNGLSDPLPDAKNKTIADYAHSLAAFLDAIGVEGCILYGRHTGASIALAFSQLYPDRAIFVYCDGYPVFEKSEIEHYLGDYLAPFSADWAGGFLSWLWFRYRDQHSFWPWHLHRSDKRSDTDVPEPEFIQRGVLDFLLSGNNYIAPYAMAINAGAELDFRNTPVPTCFAIRPGDSLYNVQQRLKNLPDNSWCEELPRETATAVAREAEILCRYAADHSAPPAPIPRLLKQPGIASQLYVDVPGGQIGARFIKAKKPRSAPIVMIPRMPGGGTYLEQLQSKLSLSRDVIILDVPGHGNSQVDCAHRVDIYATLLNDALDQLDIRPSHVYGHGSGAMVALEMQQKMNIARIFLDEPLILDSAARGDLINHYKMSFAPEWDGTHLLRLWHQLRDEQLWQPWNVRTRKQIRTDTGVYRPDLHYALFVDILKQAENFSAGWEAALSYNSGDALTQCKAEIIQGRWAYAENGANILHGMASA